jgi:hypothetical protein
LKSKKEKNDLKSKKEKDLLIHISTVRPLLNGTTLDGKKADYAPGFRIPRYGLILLAGITIPILKDMLKKSKILIVSIFTA